MGCKTKADGERAGKTGREGDRQKEMIRSTYADESRGEKKKKSVWPLLTSPPPCRARQQAITVMSATAKSDVMPSIALLHALMYRTKGVGEERERVCVWEGGCVSD